MLVPISLILLIGLPSISICQSFPPPLFLRFGHAIYQLRVETDQGDTGDEVNEDNAEPDFKKRCGYG